MPKNDTARLSSGSPAYVEAEVRAELAAMLLQNAKVPLFTATGIAVLVASVFWNHVPQGVLSAWFAGIIAVNAARFLLLRRWRSEGTQPTDHHAAVYSWTIALSGIV